MLEVEAGTWACKGGLVTFDETVNYEDQLNNVRKISHWRSGMVVSQIETGEMDLIEGTLKSLVLSMLYQNF